MYSKVSFLMASFLCLHANEMREIIQQHRINGFESPGGTDKDTLHSYIEPYTRLLKPFRNQQCDLLEIGVWTGGSALIWHDFLPKSRLNLFDIKDRLALNIRASLDPHRYSFTAINAYTPHGIDIAREKAPQGYDIIIDDGDHVLQSQIFVLQRYSSLLKSGGILIIEDIQSDKDLEALKRAVPKEFSYEVIDIRPVKGRYDDLMIAIRKP